MNSLICIILFLLITLTLSQQRTYPYYCTAADRQVEVCTADYVPVCGWFSKNVNCLVHPCAVTLSNSIAILADYFW